VAGGCEHDNEPSGFIKGGELTSSVTIRVPRRPLFFVVSWWLVGWLVSINVYIRQTNLKL